MESLAGEEVSKFMKGEHVMHHVPGLWNGIWSDMFMQLFSCAMVMVLKHKANERIWRKLAWGFQSIASRRKWRLSHKNNKKCIKVGSKKVFDTSVIYSRVTGIQESSRDIDIQNILRHELSPVPTFKFQDSGAMRICKGNRTWKSELQRKFHRDVVYQMLEQPYWMARLSCGLYIGLLKEPPLTPWITSRST